MMGLIPLLISQVILIFCVICATVVNIQQRKIIKQWENTASGWQQAYTSAQEVANRFEANAAEWRGMYEQVRAVLK